MKNMEIESSSMCFSCGKNLYAIKHVLIKETFLKEGEYIFGYMCKKCGYKDLDKQKIESLFAQFLERFKL
jgi:C4-type Zn-finger protein